MFADFIARTTWMRAFIRAHAYAYVRVQGEITGALRSRRATSTPVYRSMRLPHDDEHITRGVRVRRSTDDR